MMQLVGAF